MVEAGAKIRNVEVIRTPCYVETVEWDTSVYDRYLKNKSYLLFFGRFQLHKGFHILAQALPRVLRDHPDCTVALVGLDLETPLASSMKEYAVSLCEEYEERLIFISQIPHAQLYPVISRARIVVLPSLIDNFPNTCLEAMALAKPVVGTQGASFEELITEGETGFLVPAGEADVLADKIHEAWIHPQLGEIGQAAQRRVQDFSPDRTIERFLDYANSVVQGQ
jgi:glycosyltransferase involved in cell wall biosynthesis